MKGVGGDNVSRVKPPNYGEWWNTNAKGVAWYQEIHHARESIHEAFVRWVAERDRADDPIRSVLEIGCGRGVCYPELFADRRYVGCDISRKEIEWCRTNRSNPSHEYLAADFIADGIDERFDLVFAHAVIDHVYDIDAFLRAVVNASNRWVYLTAYRGWFPNRRTHRYRWGEQEACFYNDLSPARIHSVLTALGCHSVRVSCSETVIEPIGRETVIVGGRSTEPAAVEMAETASVSKRTPFEPLNRRVSKWWRRYARPAE
jgi:SAM-dependent methyltransferase